MRTVGRYALVRGLAAYLISVLVVTPITFYVIFPASTSFLKNHAADFNGWVYALYERIPQYLIYGLITALLYFIVVRHASLSPILGFKATSTKKRFVLALCIVVTFCAFTPFTVLAIPAVIGVITYMITGLSEEWTYRGVLTRVMKDRVGLVWATIIASLLFAFSHWAEVMFVGGEHPFTLNWATSMGSDFLFGVVFSIMVWRSHSILWAACMQCMADWQPWTLVAGRGWMTALHIPALGEAGIVIYVVGLIGAEIIRAA